MRDDLEYTVCSAKNEWKHSNNRPAWLYYVSGPGGTSPYAILMNGELFFDYHDEAEKTIPVVRAAYKQGYHKRSDEVSRALKSLL